MFRVIKEVRPDWVVAENVLGIIDMELDTVLSQLGSEGYTTETFVLPACSQDARNIRSRVFVLAHTYDEGIQRGEEPRVDGENWTQSDDQYLERCGGSGVRLRDGGGEASWVAQPRMDRMAHGIPDRVHRIKALGNAVSPPLIRVIGEMVMKADEYLRSSDDK
jgi:DNA (cytosine-5)-methyltransferase 1